MHLLRKEERICNTGFMPVCRGSLVQTNLVAVVVTRFLLEAAVVPWDYKRHWITLLCTIEAFRSNIPQALITILGMIPPESWSSPDGECVFVAVPTECAPELRRPPEVGVEAESEVLSRLKVLLPQIVVSGHAVKRQNSSCSKLVQNGHRLCVSRLHSHRELGHDHHYKQDHEEYHRHIWRPSELSFVSVPRHVPECLNLNTHKIQSI